jgi:hypothetical protein
LKNVILLKTALTQRRMNGRYTEETKGKRDAKEDTVKDSTK